MSQIEQSSMLVLEDEYLGIERRSSKRRGGCDRRKMIRFKTRSEDRRLCGGRRKYE